MSDIEQLRQSSGIAVTRGMIEHGFSKAGDILAYVPDERCLDPFSFLAELYTAMEQKRRSDELERAKADFP